MRIYIAAPWAERDQAREIAKRFVEAGHEITHNWWDHDVPEQDEAGLRKCATDDFYAIIHADVFYLLNTQERGHETSGKAVELGIALTLNEASEKPRIYATGIKGTNVFQLLPSIKWVAGVEEVLADVN